MEKFTTRVLNRRSQEVVLKGIRKMEIYGDRFRLSQVLLNILTNADKYASMSGKIIVTVKSQKKNIVVSVQDFGPGISKENQKRIFERFFQVDSLGNPKSGLPSLGMGLYIASKIIHHHKGKIWVKSDVGKGSTFYFTLPVINS